MLAAYKKEIEKRLKERGFSPHGRVDWTRTGEFRIVFKLLPLLPSVVSFDSISDADSIFIIAEIWMQNRNDDPDTRARQDCIWMLSSQESLMLAKRQIAFDSSTAEKSGFSWIDENIQALYKEAYDILVAKARTAAEAAITGIDGRAETIAE